MLSWLGVIPTVLTFLTGLGGTASSISKDIRDLNLAKEKTKSDSELKRIDAELSLKLAQKDVLVSEAGSRINGIARLVLAAGPILYVLKYYAVDKVIGSLAGCTGEAGRDIACHIYRTDPLNTEMSFVLTAVLGFYLLYSTFGRK